MNILVISDAKPGHQNQSLGIAERLPGARIHIVTHKLKESLSESLLRWRVGRSHGRMKPEAARRTLARLIPEETLNGIKSFSPQLVISTGTTSASVNLLCKSYFKIPSVCIMRPYLIPLDSFDLAVLPAHDAAPDLPNIVRLVITPNRASPELAKSEAREFSTRTGHRPDLKYLGVIIGGEARGMRFPSDECLAMLETCYRWAVENDIILLITTSRRTGDALEAAIEERWGDNPHTGYLLLAGRDKENPTYAFHGLAGRALITADSVSMVSEAIYAGVKPIVLDLSGGAAERGKRGRFYNGLRQGDYVDFIGGYGKLVEALRRSVPFSGAGVPHELGVCLEKIAGLVGRGK